MLSLLGRVHVALEVDADVGFGAGLVGLAAPDALVVLLKARDVGVAGVLDQRLRLSLGEAVAARDRLVRVVLVRAVDGVVSRPALRRLRLGARGHRGKQQQGCCQQS